MKKSFRCERKLDNPLPYENRAKKRMFKEKYFLLIIGVPVVCWALVFPFIKIGLAELSPINLTIMRLLVVCVIFLTLLIINPKKFPKLQKGDVMPIFLVGFLGITIYHLGINYGERYVSASTASVIIATIPIFVVILAAIFLKEKITSKIVLGVILSLLGVVTISIAGNPNSSLEIKYISGALAVLLAAILGAGYTVASKKLLQRYSALPLTVYVCLLGSLGLIPFISRSLFEEVSVMSVTGWSAVLFLGIFPTVIAYVLWYVALEIKTASEVGVYLYFVPILSTIVSWFMFNEKITWLFIFGGMLVILGLYIVNRQGIKAG